MTDKARRHQQIRRLLEHEQIMNQDELRRRLVGQGIRVQQATLSRDLHEIGVVKGPGGYALPGAAPETAPTQPIEQTVGQYLTAVDHGGNLVVLHTGPGRAQPFALELDNSKLDGVLGTIAGDDTVFVAARDEQHASRLARRFRQMVGQ